MFIPIDNMAYAEIDYSCIVASIVRLYYAVSYTKVPATGDSFFQAPFIYNILWALIEPPVFIIAGSLLTLGPYFRGKYGPANLFRSLRSRLLSMSSRDTSKPTETSGANHADHPAPYENLSNGSERKLWLSSVSKSSADGTVEIPPWELVELRELGEIQLPHRQDTTHTIL
jgi:hypothetical protein